MGEFTTDDVKGLAEKLQALELTAGEAAALEALVAAGETAEVQGYNLTVKDDVHPIRPSLGLSPSRLVNITMRPSTSVVINHEEQ